MKNEQKEDGQEITFTCEFKGEGKVNARFVFGEEEYKVFSITFKCTSSPSLLGMNTF